MDGLKRYFETVKQRLQVLSQCESQVSSSANQFNSRTNDVQSSLHRPLGQQSNREPFISEQLVIDMMTELLKRCCDSSYLAFVPVNSITPADQALVIVFSHIANYMRDLFVKYPKLGEVVVQFLPSIVYPQPFIEIIPSMLQNANEIVVTYTLQQLKTLSESDILLALPIVATMSNISVPRDNIDLVIETTEMALTSCNEEDFPFLTRTILRGLCVGTTANDSVHILQSIRKEVSRMSTDSKLTDELTDIFPIFIANWCKSQARSLSMNIVALVVEILLEILPMSHQLSKLFLKLISNATEEVNTFTWVVVDVVFHILNILYVNSNLVDHL